MKKILLSSLLTLLIVYGLRAQISRSLPPYPVFIESDRGQAVFKNTELYGEPGYPLLPAEKFTFLVPPDADLQSCSFNIQGLKEELLEGEFDVEPAKPPYSINGPVWPENRSIVNGKDLGIYLKNEFFPDNYIQQVSVGMMRCYKLVEVWVYFSRYNPVTKKLIRMTEGKLVLTIGKRSAVSDNCYPVPYGFQKSAERVAINYAEAAPAYNSLFSFTNKTKYVIMTESAVQSGSKKLEDLKKSKQARGFETEILTESAWGGGTGDAAAENIRKWLKANYIAMKIEYVLFIGNSDPTTGVVPMKTLSGVPCNFYFADISGETWDNKDGNAEVHVGRIPVYSNDVTTLDKILQRIIDYENAPQSSIEWRNRALFAEKPFDNKTPGSNLFEAIKKTFLDVQKWTCYRIYSDNTGTPDETSCTIDAVKNAWKKGNWGMVEWMTHGSATSASSIMNSATTAELVNEKCPPIVAMGSCSNGTIENAGNLSFSMLKSTAIGCVGASVTTLYGIGLITGFESTGYIQGVLYNFGRGIVKDSLGGGAALDLVASAQKSKTWRNITGYNYFGCPDVGVYTCSKITSMDNTPQSVSLKSGVISISARNPSTRSIGISYTVPDNDLVLVQIYDTHGKAVQTLVNAYQNAGNHTCILNGPLLSSGLYYCTVYTKHRQYGVEKIVIVK